MEWYWGVGSAIAVFLINCIVGFLNYLMVCRRDEKRARVRSAMWAQKFDIGVDEFNALSYAHPKYNEIVCHLLDDASEKYFKNRFSDFMGFLWQGFYWFSKIIVILLVMSTIWVMIEDRNFEPLVYWWGYLVYLLFYVMFFWIWIGLCVLITGLDLNEAKRRRKALCELIEEQEQLQRRATIR